MSDLANSEVDDVLGLLGECFFSFLSAEVEWCLVKAVDVLSLSYTLVS